MDRGAGRSIPGRSAKFLAGLVAELIETAEAEFKLDRPDKKGLTQRQRNIINENVGKIGPEWRPNPPPNELAHVFRWFLDLHKWRGAEDGKPKPLDYKTFAAWSEMTGTKLGPFEMDVIANLEAAFFRTWNSDAQDENIAQKMKQALRGKMNDKSLKKPEVVPRGR